jgi:triosephosphate isomerase
MSQFGQWYWRLLLRTSTEMHEFIREVVLKAFGKEAENVSILYGGSVKPENAKIFSKPDVDGGLMEEQLKADDFAAIVSAI